MKYLCLLFLCGCGTIDNMDSEFFASKSVVQVAPVVAMEPLETNISNNSLAVAPPTTALLQWDYPQGYPVAFDVLRVFDLAKTPWTKLGTTTNTFYPINITQRQAFFTVGAHKQ